MKEFNFIVGNDNGNSEHDIVINGDLVRQPNVFANVRKIPNIEEYNEKSMLQHIHDNLIVSIASSDITGNYLIGNCAVKSGERLSNIGVGVFNDKLNSKIPFVNTHSQIAGYAVKKALREDNNVKEIKVNVEMVTELPVTQYSKEGARNFADKFMNDIHTVVVYLPERSVKVDIHYIYVKVLPESIPIVHYLQQCKNDDPILKDFKEKYELNNIDGSYFKKLRILHNSIGEGTTERPLTEDIRFNANFIGGSNNGVGLAIEEILPDFKQENYLNKYKRQDFSIALRDSTNKYHDKAVEIIQIPLSQQADEIFNYTVGDISRANNDIDVLCVHGGGSIAMKEFLYNRYVELGKKLGFKVLYITGDKAVTLESLAMYIFANSKLFQKLKTTYLEKQLNEVAATKE
jgi:plasmid segregation protein ParM